MSTLNTTTSVLGSNSDTPQLPSILRLTHESNLLHLLFHRNKNQHRISKWWKDLSLLRSSVRNLIAELESVRELQTGKPAAPALSGSGMTQTQLKKLRRMEKAMKEEANATYIQAGRISGVDAIVKARERVDARLRFMRRGIIPRAWVAFTGVVATTQFSALGMILLGVLGRIYEIVGPGSAEEQEAMKAVEGRRVRGGTRREVESGWGGNRGGRSRWVHEDEESKLLVEGFDDGGVIISRELVGEEEDEMEGLGTDVERIVVVGAEGRMKPNPIDAVDDTRIHNGESEVETAGHTPTIAASEEEPPKRKKEKSKETMLPPPSLLSPQPSRSSKSAPTTPFTPDLDFFSSSSSATPGISSIPIITRPEKRKSKPESTKTDNTDKPRKKKKKQWNAIDDLFKGLV
ncbi:hypothetical protein EV426DRAFT_572026 [Tirmania nivea]|nr:hypothetical protein EV426DRAFT_572026 [Tirmania nivea]